MAWFSCLGCSNFYFRNLFFKPKIRHNNYWQIVVLKYTVPTSLEKIERFNLPSQKCHRQKLHAHKLFQKNDFQGSQKYFQAKIISSFINQ